MNVFNVADLLVKAKRYVPESARTKLCYMFADLFGNELKSRGDEWSFANWKQDGAASFLQRCEVGEAPLAVVSADLCVQESRLSEFCNKWMNVTQFRTPGGDWMPITSDMNSLRVTMVKELEELANVEREAHDSSGDSPV